MAQLVLIVFCTVLLIVLVQWSYSMGNSVKERQKRYLIFTPATQYGTFVTVSVPLPEPDNLVSVAWFYEANYYNVDNATWFEPLLGDIEVSRKREKRALKLQNEFITRSLLYIMIESMMQKHGYEGQCLLRLICETSTSHYSHNGVLGDLFHLILTPSSSHDEDMQDIYYEAEYRGLDDECGRYIEDCPSSPLNNISMFIDHVS